MIDVKAFQALHGLSHPQMVQAVKEVAPGYDKALHSKVCAPDTYGVRLTTRAEAALEAAYPSIKPRKHDNKRKPERVQCRLTTSQFRALQREATVRGYKTIQDVLEAIISTWLKEKAGALVEAADQTGS